MRSAMPEEMNKQGAGQEWKMEVKYGALWQAALGHVALPLAAAALAAAAMARTTAEAAAVALAVGVVALVALAWDRERRRRRIYMVDFVCYRPDDDRKVSKQFFLQNSRLIGLFTEDSLVFQRKILERSGLGHETYFPPAVTRLPPNPSLEEARKEADVVLYGALDELFAKTGVQAQQIAILVLNCSAFCPTPSLTAAIINHYGMRPDVAAYNLAGMGCSAGVISWDLAKRLLWLRPDSYALVLSTENITLNWYRGNEKNLLVSNCLFRMGGAAMLLTNRPDERRRAKYQLLHTVRTHKAAEDKSYFCVQQEDDPNGLLGVQLSKELMSVAAGALRTNITTLGPLILPYSEQLRFVASMLARRLLRLSVKLYSPDFRKAVEHFCIHAGGRAVLDRVEDALQLSERQMEPNRMTLYRFGNTSSSTVYYELAYLEAKGRIRAGDRIWQIGFGSGFKCNSAIWRALRHLPAHSVSNCWTPFIDNFPVPIASIDDFMNLSPAAKAPPANDAPNADSNEFVDNVVVYA